METDTQTPAQETQGRYQLAHHVIRRPISLPPPVGYRADFMSNNVSMGIAIAASILPTHIYDHEAQQETPLAEEILFTSGALKLVGPRFNDFAELEALTGAGK
jgi:hypothetical protein